MEGSEGAAMARWQPRAWLGVLKLTAAWLRAQAALELGSRQQRLLLGFRESGAGAAAIYGARGLAAHANQWSGAEAETNMAAMEESASLTVGGGRWFCPVGHGISG